MDIGQKHLETVKRIVDELMPEGEVFIFGSRAKGPTKPHSDLDILIKGLTGVDAKTMRKLKSAFEESDLPFRVDVLDWAALTESFRKIIEQDCVKIRG
jgi:predicted nucleotidyltransferase